ncbi:MAG: AAA domain-containing protein [Caldisericaceae bacterium]
MNLKGKIENTLVKNDVFITVLASQGSAYKVFSKKEIKDISKGMFVNFVNIDYKKSLFTTEYFFNDKSFVIVHPGMLIKPEEIAMSSDNKYASSVFEFALASNNQGSNEKAFYNSVRGYADTDDNIKKIAERLPKDIKAKFSIKPFEISTTFGLLIMNALYLGRYPVSFEANKLKAKIQTITSNTDKYILISNEGTLSEEKIEVLEKQSLVSSRNLIAQIFFEDSHKEILDTECPDTNPAARFIATIKEHPEEFKTFDDYFTSFLKDEYKRRIKFRKIVQSGLNPKKPSVQIRSSQGSLFELSAKIDNNEGMLNDGADIVVVEKPPLDRKTLGKVQQVTFDDLRIALDAPVVNAEFITPLNASFSKYAGLFDYAYSETIPARIAKGETVPSISISDELYIEGDSEENKAVNLILSQSPLVLVKGGYGTGKKFVVNRALAEISSKNESVIIATDSREDEFKGFLARENVQLTNANDICAIPSGKTFDYGFVFLAHPAQKNLIERILAISRKAAILTSTDSTVEIESKIPADCVVTLNSEHRFGKYMMHFVNKIAAMNLQAADDNMLAIVNKDIIDTNFIQIVNPEKFVQFVSISSKTFGKKNKWNIAEAEFTVEAISQFLKGGVDRSSIGVIVPYERQRKLIEKTLLDRKIPDIAVYEVEDAAEKDLVFINFVENEALTSKLNDAHYLKFALTRAKNKILLVGSGSLSKKENLLSKLLRK